MWDFFDILITISDGIECVLGLGCLLLLILAIPSLYKQYGIKPFLKWGGVFIICFIAAQIFANLLLDQHEKNLNDIVDKLILDTQNRVQKEINNKNRPVL